MKTRSLLLFVFPFLLVSCSGITQNLSEGNRLDNQSNSTLPADDGSDFVGPKEIYEQIYCGSDCFLGIVPGTTGFEEANDRLEELGFDPFVKNGESLSSYFVKNDENIIETSIVIKLFERNHKVSQMRITLEPRETSFSDDHLLRFSPINLLIDHGAPEELHYKNSDEDSLFNLFFIYESKGFLYITTGNLVNNSVCLLPEVARIYSVTMVIDDNTDEFSIWDGLGIKFEGNAAKVFQMTPEEIFNQVVFDDYSCIELMVE